MTPMAPGKCPRCAMPVCCHHLLQMAHAKAACMQTQGGIDALENPFAAATRELLEETGISSVTFLAQVI